MIILPILFHVQWTKRLPWVHPGRLTWTIIIEVRKIIFPSKWVICRFLPLIFQGVAGSVVFLWPLGLITSCWKTWVAKFFATRLRQGYLNWWSIVRVVAEGNSSPKKCTKHSGLGCHFKKIPFKSRASCRNFGWKNWRICWVLFLSQKKEKSLVPSTCRIKMTYMGSRWLTKAPSPKKDVFLLLFLWFTSSRWSNAAGFPLVHGCGVRKYWKKSLQRVVKFW